MKSQKHSLVKIIMLFFIPTMITATLITAIVNYKVSYDHMRKLVAENVYGTVSHLSRYLQASLYRVFEEFVRLEQYRVAGSVLFEVDDNGNYTLDSGFMARMHIDLEKVYSQNYDVVDSIFIGFEFPDGSQEYAFFSKERTYRINFDTSEKWLKDSPGSYCWVSPHESDVIKSVDTGDVLSLFKYSVDSNTGISCLILVNMNTQFFYDVLKTEQVKANNYLALGIDGTLVYPGNPEISPIGGNAVSELSFNSPTHTEYAFNDDGKMTMLTYEKIPINGWHVISITDMQYMASVSNRVRDVSLLMIALVLVFSLSVSYLFARLISNPIDRWLKKLESISGNRFDIVFDDNLCQEITKINNGLNHLIASVRAQMNEKEEESERRRGLEMALLQQQIDPHFLYNTLFSIQQLYAIGENDKAAKMTADLSGFFRFSLGKGREIVTFAWELEHLRHYMDIQRVRHSDIKYCCEIPAHLLRCRFLKLTLQPLVENAIDHGLFTKRNGEINIYAYEENHDIVITVSDNGVGMDSDLVDLLNECLQDGSWEQMPDGYGVKNVHERIKLHFGPGYGLHYESVLGSGTSVVVRFPFMVGDDDV